MYQLFTVDTLLPALCCILRVERFMALNVYVLRGVCDMLAGVHSSTCKMRRFILFKYFFFVSASAWPHKTSPAAGVSHDSVTRNGSLALLSAVFCSALFRLPPSRKRAQRWTAPPATYPSQETTSGDVSCLTR